MAETTWIVVADASRARVVERRGKAATELEDFLSPEGRDLGVEASGRFFAKGGPAAGPGHAARPETNPLEHSIDLRALLERIGPAA
jgi:hypothetical protein